MPYKLPEVPSTHASKVVLTALDSTQPAGYYPTPQLHTIPTSSSFVPEGIRKISTGQIFKYSKFTIQKENQKGIQKKIQKKNSEKKFRKKKFRKKTEYNFL